MPEELNREIAEALVASESARATETRWKQTVEIIEAALLAIVAVATAWSGYQAARWDGRQAELYGTSSTMRNEADQALTLGGQQRLLDVTTFNTWIEARNEGRDDLAALYERRFSPEFKVAFDAWIALDPFSNPDAPPGPGFMPEYENHLLDEGARLNDASDRTFDEDKVTASGRRLHPHDRGARDRAVPARTLPAVPDPAGADAVVVLAAGLMIYGLVTIAAFPRLDTLPAGTSPVGTLLAETLLAETLLDGGIRTHSRCVRYRRAPTLDPLERLERVQRVSDATLAHLSVDDLLDELLNRVREILDTDTAAVLLLDEARNELVARAAKGIEEEVERASASPWGRVRRSHRGRAEARRPQPGRPQHRPEPDPVPEGHPFTPRCAAPRAGRGGRRDARGDEDAPAFPRDEVELLQLVADRVALALRVRLSDRSRVVIEAFQRTFLPEVLPFLPGLRVATRYLPADRRRCGRRLVRHVRPARG